MDTLSCMPFAVVDCQTTGASPATGRVIEMAWQCRSRLSESGETMSALVRLPAGEAMPVQATRITGITAAEVEGALTESEVWACFSADTSKVSRDGHILFVAHYARFEMPFIIAMQKRHGIPEAKISFLCTYEISRRLYPALPKHTLRAVAGFFECPLPEKRRAFEHASATGRIWEKLVEGLSFQGIQTLPDVYDFLAEKPALKARRRVPNQGAIKRAFPAGPGIYRFVDAKGNVLYVGKAKNLNGRFRSYFSALERKGGHIREMLSQAFDASCTPTRTALEAALLEASEIRRLCPPYNRALRNEDKPLWYYSTDFSQKSEAPSSLFSSGPFPRCGPVDALIGCLDVAADATQRPLPTYLAGRISHEALREGMRLLLSTFAHVWSGPPTLHKLMALGLIHRSAHRDEKATTKKKQEAEETDTREADPINDAARTIVRIASDAAVQWYWGRLVRLLTDSTIRFEMRSNADNAGCRELRFRRGELLSARDVKVDDPVEPFLRTHEHPFCSVPGFRREQYDMFRVLLSELRRIQNAGRAVMVCFSENLIWDSIRFGNFLNGLKQINL